MAKLYMLNSVMDTINTSFILRDGEYTLALDGGFPCEAEKLYQCLHALGGVVDAWFLTHIHEDHISALITLLRDHSDIVVKKVYCNFPSEAFLARYEPHQSKIESVELSRLFSQTLAERSIPIVTVQEDEIYRFGELSVKVLLTPDEGIVCNPINNSSCVYLFACNGQRLLFLGDLGVEGGNRLLGRAQELKADYVQMAHHGQGGVSKEVYEAVQPKYCLWCTPTWVWDSADKKNFKFKTDVVRGWMREMGCVQKHYIMFQGDHIIEL